MRALVTGAAGFIGTHLTTKLADEGNQVVAFDIRMPSKRGNVQPVVADICDVDAVALAMTDVDVVFHQAAMASVPESFVDPAKCMMTNIVGSSVIFEQARLAGVRRVVMASTSSIYGDDPTPVKHEDLPPLPRSPYAVSKLAMEQLADVYARQFSMEMVSLRYFNVYGAGQPAEGGYAALIPSLAKSLSTGSTPTIYGDGEQTRGFVHVSDVATANLEASRFEFDTALGVQVINIAAPDVITVNEVLHAVANALRVPIDAIYESTRPGDIRHSRADISRAQHLLNFRSTVDFQDGIRGVLEGFRSSDKN